MNTITCLALWKNWQRQVGGQLEAVAGSDDYPLHLGHGVVGESWLVAEQELVLFRVSTNTCLDLSYSHPGNLEYRT